MSVRAGGREGCASRVMGRGPFTRRTGLFGCRGRSPSPEDTVWCRLVRRAHRVVSAPWAFAHHTVLATLSVAVDLGPQ